MSPTYNGSLRAKVFGTVQRFIEPCILLLLSKGSSHGYGLLQGLEKHCGEKVDIGNLYRTLRRMESDSWLKSQWDENKSGRGRRIYTISKKGQKFLGEAAASLLQTDKLIHIFLSGYKKIFPKGELL